MRISKQQARKARKLSGIERHPRLYDERVPRDASVSSVKIARLAVLNEKIATSAVSSRTIAPAAVTTGKIENYSLTEEKYAQESVSSRAIAAGAVGTAKLQNYSLTEEKYVQESVSSRAIAAGAVGTAKLQNYSLTEEKYVQESVSSRAIAAGAVGTAKLAEGAVTVSKLDPAHTGGQNADGPPQANRGLRKIGTQLGGSSLRAAAADHSHGSGNTMHFDALPERERRAALAVRVAVRRSALRAPREAPVSRREFRQLQKLVLHLAHILHDAPDLDAFERERLRRRGVPFPEMFEWRRPHDEYIHQPHLPYYARPHEDAAAVLAPEG